MVSVLAVVFSASAAAMVRIEHYWAAPLMVLLSLVKQDGMWANFVAQIFLLCAQVTVS